MALSVLRISSLSDGDAIEELLDVLVLDGCALLDEGGGLRRAQHLGDVLRLSRLAHHA